MDFSWYHSEKGVSLSKCNMLLRSDLNHFREKCNPKFNESLIFFSDQCLQSSMFIHDQTQHTSDGYFWCSLHSLSCMPFTAISIVVANNNLQTNTVVIKTGKPSKTYAEKPRKTSVTSFTCTTLLLWPR